MILFISNAFISNSRLKLAKGLAKAKYDAYAELRLFENNSLSSSTVFSKNIGRYSKNGQKTSVSVLISTAQKKKFFINDFFRKCDQTRSWSHLLKKSLIVNLIYVQ